MNKYVLDALTFGLLSVFMTVIAIVVTVYQAGGEAIGLTFTTAAMAWAIYIACIIFRIRADRIAEHYEDEDQIGEDQTDEE